MDRRNALIGLVFIVIMAETSFVRSLILPTPPVPPLWSLHSPPPPPGSSAGEGSSPSRATKIIESFHVKSDIRYRFATTQMVSVVRNTADQAQEISFDVILSKEAFIVSFSMEIDGKVYDGEVKEKSEAKKEYQAAVDQGQSAGHIKQAHRHSNIFEVSVNVANGSAVTFSLTYQEMLRRKLGVYEQEIHVEPGQAVENFIVEVYIQENKPLRFVKTPALRNDSLITNQIEEENKLTIVDRPSSETAYIKYEPSVKEQGDKGMSARFVVQYDVEHGSKGDVLVVDGYFVHFFAPDLPSMPKDIIFVLDVSGSMYGRKIEQLQTAMLAILSDLRPEDRFNIITFSSDVQTWRPDLLDARGENMREAKQFVKEMRADGMTNINMALLEAITKLKGREDKQRVPMIFFLTDGVPTVGVQEPEKIAANVFDSNGNTAAIFGLAFGTGADFDSLKTICGQNSGFARKIYEASDSALQVASFYQEISAVAMKDISIEYMPSSVDEYTITDREFPIVFNGTEIMICGRMADEAETFELEIKGLQKSGEVSLVLEIDDINNFILEDDNSLNPFFTMPRDFAGIVEKMWAYLTIKQLLLEKERHVSDEVKAKELTDKILQMSLKYKFVTPLTSMVVTKPDSQDKPIESGLEDGDDVAGDLPAARHVSHSHAYGFAGLPGVHGYPQYSSYPAAVQSQTRRGTGKSHDPVPSLHASTTSFKYKSPPHIAVSATAAPQPPVRRTTAANGKNLKKKAYRKTSGHLNGIILSSISAKSGNLTMCLAPRKIGDGIYNIFQSSTGAVVSLQTVCLDKHCRNSGIKHISLTSGNQTAFLTVDSSKQDWMFGADSPLTVRADEDIVKITGADIEIVLERQSKKMFDFMTVEIILGSADSSTGLLGDLLNMPPKKLKKLQKKKAPAACRKQNALVSKSFNSKLARKYKQ